MTARTVARVFNPCGRRLDSTTCVNPRPFDGRALQVGYGSADFREHTVARFIEPALEGHDRSAVMAVCYSYAARPDRVTARLRGHAAEWRDTAGLSHDALAQQIRDDGWPHHPCSIIVAWRRGWKRPTERCGANAGGGRAAGRRIDIPRLADRWWRR